MFFNEFCKYMFQNTELDATFEHISIKLGRRQQSVQSKNTCLNHSTGEHSIMIGYEEASSAVRFYKVAQISHTFLFRLCWGEPRAETSC